MLRSGIPANLTVLTDISISQMKEVEYIKEKYCPRIKTRNRDIKDRTNLHERDGFGSYSSLRVLSIQKTPPYLLDQVKIPFTLVKLATRRFSHMFTMKYKLNIDTW
jgi:hypothetical protein